MHVLHRFLHGGTASLRCRQHLFRALRGGACRFGYFPHGDRQAFDRAQRPRRFLCLVFGCRGHLTGVFSQRRCGLVHTLGGFSCLPHQFAESLQHQVKRISQVAEHVRRHLASFRQVALPYVADESQELLETSLHHVSLFLRLDEGCNSVEHLVERSGHMTQFVLALH